MNSRFFMNIKVVVLISGHGSNLQALIDHVQAGRLPVSMEAVISNRPGAYGLERARSAGIPALCLDHTEYPDREAYDLALIKTIQNINPDRIILAGFMRILTPCFIQTFANKIINIHPSLLPRHKGLQTHQQVLKYGDREHGCSIHYVTKDLDAGPVITQASFQVEATDTIETLRARIHALEHRLYPLTLYWICELSPELPRRMSEMELENEYRNWLNRFTS